jgi:RHS repeat-associated protein
MEWVISSNPSTQTRLTTYNWRGQAMSSVFPDGTGADNTTGNGTEVDWSAKTQAQTYFTPALDETNSESNAKMWLGAFVQNAQGTTTMLYRRNRYFDANTGRFTQEDPLGIAGGVNQYGFTNGDPVNFSDPFGLCRGPSDIWCVGETKPGVLGTMTAALGEAAKRWWAAH